MPYNLDNQEIITVNGLVTIGVNDFKHTLYLIDDGDEHSLSFYTKNKEDFSNITFIHYKDKMFKDCKLNSKTKTRSGWAYGFSFSTYTDINEYPDNKTNTIPYIYINDKKIPVLYFKESYISSHSTIEILTKQKIGNVGIVDIRHSDGRFYINCDLFGECIAIEYIDDIVDNDKILYEFYGDGDDWHHYIFTYNERTIMDDSEDVKQEINEIANIGPNYRYVTFIEIETPHTIVNGQRVLCQSYNNPNRIDIAYLAGRSGCKMIFVYKDPRSGVERYGLYPTKIDP